MGIEVEAAVSILGSWSIVWVLMLGCFGHMPLPMKVTTFVLIDFADKDSKRSNWSGSS